MRRYSIYLFLVFSVMVILACQTVSDIPLSPPTSEPTPTSTRIPDGSVYYEVPLNATGTPTPFVPVASTALAFTPTAEATPSWGKYPGPSVYSDLPIPPPVDRIEQPAGQINFLLLGSDQRKYDGSFRTDTILLVTLNPNLGTVNITSFPRDLYVYIPGWTMQRINTAFQKGGFELLAATFEYNLGVLPDHFVLVNFQGFVRGINSLGGIEVQVAEAFNDGVDSVPEGLVHMTGNKALWYVRSRYSSNDFDRSRRQQEVLLAVFLKLISVDAVKRAPELFELYRNNVITDLTLGEATPLLGLASQLGNDPSRINSFFIGPKHVTSYWVPSSGAQVLLPNTEDILVVMREALNAPE